MKTQLRKKQFRANPHASYSFYFRSYSINLHSIECNKQTIDRQKKEQN